MAARKEFVITRRLSLAEEAALMIKRLIFNQHFKSGERLIVDSLSKQLQVSVTPIREGLKILVAEGLVEYQGKSYSVFSPSPEEVHELFMIRSYLEQLSVHQAATMMEDVYIDELLKRYREFAESDKIYDTFEQIEMDKFYHSSILESTANRRLKELLEPLQEQCWLLRSWGFSNLYTKEIAESTVKEHLRILECIKDRDPACAEQIMKEHMAKGESGTVETYKMKTE